MAQVDDSGNLMGMGANIKRLACEQDQAELFNHSAKWLTEALSSSLWVYGIDKIDISVSKENSDFFVIGIRLKRELDVTLSIRPADYILGDDKMVELCDLIKEAIDKRLEKDSKVLALEVKYARCGKR